LVTAQPSSFGLPFSVENGKKQGALGLLHRSYGAKAPIRRPPLSQDGRGAGGEGRAE